MVLDPKRNIVRVEWATEVLGTAFIVALKDGRSAVLTCAHVVELAAERAGKKKGQEALRLTLCALLDGQPTLKVVVDWDNVRSNEDLALLVIESTPGHDAILGELSPLLLAVNDEGENHAFETYGFALRNIDSHAVPTEIDPSIRRGSKQRGTIAYFDAGDFPTLQLGNARNLARGFSGAPVVDTETRRVAGIVKVVDREDEDGRGGENAWAVPASVIRKVFPNLVEGLDCPFQGLAPFTEATRKYWVDPSELTKKVFVKLDADETFISIIGPSGVGKSSLLDAGVLPGLRERAKNWAADVVLIRLNRIDASKMAHKFATDTASLTTVEETNGNSERAAENDKKRAGILRELLRDWGQPNKSGGSGENPGAIRNLVVLIDQFEELLLIDDIEQTKKLINAFNMLLEGTAGKKPVVRILIALREHYLGALGERAASFKALVLRAQMPIPQAIPLGMLQRIITYPARLAGFAWNDPLFVDGLLAAVRQGYATEKNGDVKSTALPALQVFLEQQWRNREARMALPQNVQQEFDAALENLIKEMLTRETAAGGRWTGKLGELKALTIQVLVELVAFGVGSEAKTPKGQARRRSEIVRAVLGDASSNPKKIDEVKKLIDVLAEGKTRILAIRKSDDPANTDEIVEPVHDRVLMGWRELAEPIEKQREFKSWQTQVADAANALDTIIKENPKVSGRQLWKLGKDYLLAGRELHRANHWVDFRKHAIDAKIVRLVEESNARDGWNVRIRKGLAFGLGCVGLGFLAALGYALYVDNKAKLDAAQQAKNHAESTATLITERLQQFRRAQLEQAKISLHAIGIEPLALVTAIQGAEAIELQGGNRALRLEATGSLLRTILAFQSRVPFDGLSATSTASVALTADGKRAVFRTYDFDNDKEVYDLFDTYTGARVRRKPVGDRPLRVLGLENATSPYDWGKFDYESYLTGDRTALLDATGDVALLEPNTSEMWLSRAPDPGLRRIDLEKGDITSIDLQGSWRVSDIHRSANGKMVTLGTSEGAIIVLDANERRVLRTIPKPPEDRGPVLQVAASDDGQRIISARSKHACYYPPKSESCKPLNKSDKINFNSVDITGDGKMSIVSGATYGFLSVLEVFLYIVLDDRVERVKQSTALWDMELPLTDTITDNTSGNHSDPKFTMDAATFIENDLLNAARISISFERKESSVVESQGYTVKRLIRSSALGEHRALDDGTWIYSLQGIPRANSRGVFRPVGAAGAYTILRSANRWLRITNSNQAQLRKVLGFDARTSEVLLWETEVPGGSRHLILAQLAPDGHNLEEIKQIPTAGFQLKPTKRATDTKKSFGSTNEKDADIIQIEGNGGRIAVLWRSGRAEVIDVKTNTVAWEMDHDIVGEILAYDAETDVLVLSSKDEAQIYQGGRRSGSSKTVGNASILPLTPVPIVRLSNDLVDLSGRTISVPDLVKKTLEIKIRDERDADKAKSVTLADVVVSPDKKWVVFSFNGAAPGVARVENEDPPRFGEAIPLNAPAQWAAPVKINELDPMDTTSPHKNGISVKWLSGRPGDPSKLVITGRGYTVIWTLTAAGWKANPMADERSAYSVDHIVSSPNAELAAIERTTDRFEEDGIVHSAYGPAHLIELRKMTDWSLIGVIGMAGHKASQIGPVWVDDEHLFLPDEPRFPDEPRIVSLKPEDLRQRACKLLRDRSEYQQVAEICNVSTGPTQ